MNGKEQRIATSFWTLQGGQGDPSIVGPSWPISPQETTPEAASEETFDNVKGIAQPGCQHHFFWFFHSAADRRKRQMILTCFNLSIAFNCQGVAIRQEAPFQAVDCRQPSSQFRVRVLSSVSQPPSLGHFCHLSTFIHYFRLEWVRSRRDGVRDHAGP